MRGVPTLVVWSDFYDQSPLWRTYRGNVERWLGAVREGGVRVDAVDLPALGIRGNSHMLMIDRNSDEIAVKVQDWLAGQDLHQ